MYNASERPRLQVEDLPELETEVALSAAPKQQEVGGAVCAGIAIGVAIYAMN